jgi:hypothetical protein
MLRTVKPTPELIEAIEWRNCSRRSTLAAFDSGALGAVRKDVQMESDKEYFVRRASEERAAALNSGDERVRHTHKELAKRYEELVRAPSIH